MVPAGQVRLELADGQPAFDSKRWTSLAYSGGVFAQWWSPNCIIDLATLQLPKPGRSLPCRLGHWGSGETWDPNKSNRIGFCDAFELTGEGLVVGGGFLSNDLADKIREDAAQGYPWEVSIITDGMWDRVPDGESEVVNGVEMHSGSYIMRNAKLRATDYVELGADSGNEIKQLAALAAEHGLIARQPGAGNGAPAMATNATLETVNTDDITLDWLRENKPELVDELTGETEEETEDASAEAEKDDDTSAETERDETEPDGAEMSRPATLAQLKGLKGADAQFVLDSMEAKLSLPDAQSKLIEKLHGDLDAERQRAKLAAEAGGTAPVSTSKGKGGTAPTGAKLSGTDPAKDWAESEQLRKHYTAECGGNEQLGQTAFLRSAQACQDAGESYLDMLPKTVTG